MQGRTMEIPIHVLMVEDSEDDAILIARELKRGGYEPVTKRVDSEEAMRTALDQDKWDLIICDHSMPYFSGNDALKLLRETGSEAPFIFVSGTIGEDTAIEALKQGAQDYLMKGNLKRLIPAVRRELLEVEHSRQRRHMEKEIQQLQKFEAIGRLAGGVAHDFNNLLGVITACTELLRSHVDFESGEYVDNIREAAKRGASLTRQLLAFGRQQHAQVQNQVLDLNERLKDVMKLLRPLMGDDVEIALLSQSAAAAVEIDPGQLDQIVVNLAVNARDAMPRGGKLIVETSTVEFDDGFANGHLPLTAGRYIVLGVSDNGIGMSEATRSRIFEPFFTTKEIGKGTGLGLATVYGIVKQSGGHIWVESELEHGTTFKIYLPCADPKSRNTSHDGQADALPARRSGTTILLTEDEPIMRRMMRKMLEDHGYCVIEASDGKAALEAIENNPTRVDITLTDVVMKGMTGPELALRLIDKHPGMKVVYMSGYAGELMENRGPDIGIRLLEKPFTRASLLKALDTALG
jgi:two-component system, cell cycle sensor histidine kinase and response regulator CckA